MANLNFKHAKITGLCTVVPKKKIKLDDEACYYDDISKIKRLKMIVGVNERTVVSAETTPADLMKYAADKLLLGMNIDRSSIDAIICVLDYPDYKCPPTACILQGKLDLPNTCMAFDVTHGCAGYVYGLNIAFSLIESGYKKVLLLVGDTKSKTVNIKDRVSAPIFGDGAAATIIEYCEHISESYFLLGTNGKEYENIMIPAGGARMPYSAETSRETIDEYGNIRSQNNFRMNGKKVFDFTMNTVPENIDNLLNISNISIEEIDYLILHQANKAIIQNIAMRVGVKDLKKVPVAALSKYGNLAVASIPSAISDTLHDKIIDANKKVLLSGFGVGLSYGSAILELNNIYVPEILIYEEEK